LPVIAGRSGGPETFINPQSGIIVKPDDPEELANAIYIMEKNYSRFPQQYIREYTVRNFSRSIIARQYIDLYEGIINKL
jgi:L-malate glycosyltransferase